jgi:hypothetical protein
MESLADELEFYDQADDFNTMVDYDPHDGVYEQYENNIIVEKFDTKLNLEEEKEPIGSKFQDTGSSGDIQNYVLCPNCLERKGSVLGTTSSTGNEDPKPWDEMMQKYLKKRDPMKEFFVLTAQSVKLNSPYMDAVLTLPIKEMYSQVVKSNTPFNRWAQWVEDYLHRTIMSKIYVEAFEKQSRMERVDVRPSKPGNDKSIVEKKEGTKKGFSFFRFIRRNKKGRNQKSEKKASM